VLPLKDDNPTRRFPVLTWLLIAVNVAIFIFQFTRPNDDSLSSQTAFICEYGLVPDNLIHGGRDEDPVSEFLPVQPGEVTCAELNEDRGSRFLGLITSQFLHGDWFHLGFNMLFLLVFGNNIEDRLGRLRFLPFYLLCGVLAALTQALVNPSSQAPLIGASGAIAGVLGAYILLFPTARVWTYIAPFFVLPIPAWVTLGLWFLFQLLYAGGSTQAGGGVAYFAHIGGFIAGLLLIRPFLAGREPPAPRGRVVGPVY
jgi:membrane associated rhomboid family serine protease